MTYRDAMTTRARSRERRAEIVRAALDVIAERGYRGASLAAVAERVGLTQQGLLHHFPTKEALLVAVLEERDHWDALPGRRLRMDLLTALVEYNAMRPGIIQTFSALLGESVTDGHRHARSSPSATTGSAPPWRTCCAPSTATGCERPHPRAGGTADRGRPRRAPVPVAAGPRGGGHAGRLPDFAVLLGEPVP